MYMSVSVHIYVLCLQRPEENVDLLGLELQLIVNPRKWEMGTKPRFLCKNTKFS